MACLAEIDRAGCALYCLRALKKLLPLLVIVLSLFWLGCPKQPLSLDKHGSAIAPALGHHSEEMRYINHVLFARVERESHEIGTTHVGFVTLIGNDLILAEGKARTGQHEVIFRLPIQDLEGLADVSNHLQLRHAGETVVILPFIWFTDTLDTKQMDELAQILASVPRIEPLEGLQFGRGVLAAGSSLSSLRYQLQEDFPDLYDNGGVSRSQIEKPPPTPKPLYPVQLNNNLNGTPPPYPQGQYPTTGQ